MTIYVTVYSETLIYLREYRIEGIKSEGTINGFYWHGFYAGWKYGDTEDT